jgi:hypothetical protein
MKMSNVQLIIIDETKLPKNPYHIPFDLPDKPIRQEMPSAVVWAECQQSILKSAIPIEMLDEILQEYNDKRSVSWVNKGSGIGYRPVTFSEFVSQYLQEQLGRVSK